MIVFPAIDLKDGACVRLEKGLMDRATEYNPDPADQAARFATAGAAWLHVVDLNGAFAGRPVNEAAVRLILGATSLSVQLGGGIRTRERIDGWLAAGVARVVLGTAALRDPDLVVEGCRAHPGRIAVGIDAKGGKVAVQGWAETTEITALELARRFEDSGVAAIIFTNIDRDGVKSGVDVDATAALARAVSIPVIASGGVASLADIAAVKARAGDGIAGVISGRALYDGSLDLGEAIRLAQAA